MASVTIYKQRNRDGSEGTYWWLSYYLNGRRVRESTKTADEGKARRTARGIEGKLEGGVPVVAHADRVTFLDAADDLRAHYVVSGTRDLAEYDRRVAPLRQHFGTFRLAAITAPAIVRYAGVRHAAGLANGSINRELSTCSTILRHAHANDKLARVPTVRKLREADPRQGFFERPIFEAVRRLLRPDLRVAVTIAYTYGWRMQSEVLRLERRHVDLDAGTLTLDAGMTKTRKARLVVLSPELTAMLREQMARVDAVQRQTGAIIPWLFPYLGRRFRGQRIHDFRKAWRTACTAVGAHAMLRHDFRRTAVRNMVNAGVPERVAMTVTGHRSRAVFDRYHIVNAADLRAATERVVMFSDIAAGNPRTEVANMLG